MPAMPSLLFFHRTCQRCRLAMQAMHCIPSSSYPYLQFQPKWFSTQGPFPFTTESFSCTQFISNTAPMREGKFFAGTKLLQAAQLSGKATNINKEIKIPSRVDINAEAEAQRALLDYLHDTRNLNFTYAEYIVMNAPSFVKKLLAKARAGKDIRKSVDKYLQYNPINEFEPFFESIGIKPSEIGALLSNGQIYLSENTVLMHNVSTLWNHGIARNRLGQIYKEEKDIFSQPPGVLQGMLQAYENLGLTKACLAKIFVSCPSLLNSNIDKEFDALINNLYGLGLGKDQICSFLESNPSSWRGISEKLRLLDSFGCPREEVGRYVRTNLEALVECSKKNLKSKVSFLLKSGMAKKSTVPQDPGLLWDKNIDRDKHRRASTSNTNTCTNKNTFVETKIPDRVHINAEAETQRALLDYLYNTRNLDFTYAEYIVMNAPRFVKKLLAKARAGKDIRKSVDKYLQYNPINEFEPFFESIGIKPSEIGALLATDQIYLSENTVLMHNVSTLWNHGIARNRLGQIYKEEKDIFSQPPGVLQGMLQAYENLGLTKACLAKIFVSCPSLLNGNIDKEFDALVNNLYGLGLGKDQICSFLESNPSSWKGISEKLRLLDSFGCPREEVGRYVSTNLQALVECSKKNLKSQVRFLLKSGMAKKSTVPQDPGLLWDKNTDRDKHRRGSTSNTNTYTNKNTFVETEIPDRGHINAEAETQRALLDYLYNTRNLNFTYAEYIVMNAPSFVKKLLAKARAGKDIRKSVDKYLQYNPINEFEPFFESIGIKPSEIGALLATDQIYLSKSTVLMHNVSTLWNHGIARNMLGQIYKEEKDIFSQPPGVLQGMLQAYENLGLTKACLAKIFVSCPSFLNGNIDKEFDALINNLYGLGLGKDQICSFLESNPSSWRGISEKLRLLDSFGCPREEVGRYVRTNLQALVECSKKNLKSEVSFLLKSGMAKKSTVPQDPGLLWDKNIDRNKHQRGSISNTNTHTNNNTFVETKILDRVHINAEAETQRALLDYIYNKRNLNFTYAEYIVMNAPSFIKKLLSKASAGKDIRKSVDKYLQYNPINEFKPFFESISIKPSEIGALLATDQIYLSENKVLMHNVSTLWNYGIPRNRLGQIYKEERDIFNYPPGVLQGILQAYEKLRLTKACLAKIFVSCPSLLNGNIDKEFDALINNLYVLGMGKDQICSFFESNPSSWRGISEKLRPLDSFGCPKEEVGRHARTNFQALAECSETNLKSQVSFLSKSGMAKKNTVPQDPGLLRDKHIDRDKHRIGSKSNRNTHTNTNTEIKTPDRVHINVEAETQRALLDYLHDTRNLNFTYAEYIVMNAPNFIKKLLAKARAGKDIRKAVDKYLQYNPINEFEPFLESIGIKPSEISALLAADQIYLSENMVLMHNVSTLWNYGIQRNRLGKIYKEEKEIFNLSPGVLQGMLQAYENLGLTKACLAKIFVSCPSLLNGNIDKEFDALLNNLYQLGMEKDQICTTFESKPSSWRGISEKLMLLDSFGCPREEVSRYVRTNFQALVECSEKDLKSKVGFLSKLGMTKKNIGKSVLQYPELFIWDIHNSMAEDLNFLRGKQLKQTEIQGILRNIPHLLGTHSFKSPR